MSCNIQTQNCSPEKSIPTFSSADYPNRPYFYFLKSLKRWPFANMHCSTRERALMINTIYGLIKSNNVLSPVFFHAVWIMDMVMNTLPYSKGPLLAITCYVLASKYEEESFIDKTQVEQLISLKDLWHAEKRVWKTLNFNLTCPNLMFLIRYISWSGDDGNCLTRSLAKILLYTTVYHKQYVLYSPVKLATAAMYMAKLIQGMDPDPILAISEEQYSDVQPIIQFIKRTVIDIQPHNLCGPLCKPILVDNVDIVSLIKNRIPTLHVKEIG